MIMREYEIKVNRIQRKPGRGNTEGQSQTGVAAQKTLTGFRSIR